MRQIELSIDSSVTLLVNTVSFEITPYPLCQIRFVLAVCLCTLISDYVFICLVVCMFAWLCHSLTHDGLELANALEDVVWHFVGH